MKIKYALWLIVLFSLDSDFSIPSIRSDVIVFVSIVFGFYVSTFTYIIFSPLARKLYGTSNYGELTTEFHKVIAIYKKSIILNIVTIILLLFFNQINYIFLIYLRYLLTIKTISILNNAIYIALVVYNILLFLDILTVNINFSILNMRNADNST